MDRVSLTLTRGSVVAMTVSLLWLMFLFALLVLERRGVVESKLTGR